MILSDFPDAPSRPGALQPPATIANVEALVTSAEIACRYNVIKKKVEIDVPGFSGTPDNRDNVTMTTIIDLATKVGMPHGLVPEYVYAIADRNAYNPVANWITSRAWDKIDRFPAFAATVVQQGDYPEHLKCTLLQKWVRSAAAAVTRPQYKGRGVLTFQGEQGVGKTSWIKALIDDPSLRDRVIKLDHHLDAGNKDSVFAAISNWIVEIGELDSSFKRDVARLKGFLTADSDTLRRPYDRKESEYARRTVFAATVNDANFLVDRTGNTRWWTIAVDRLDYAHTVNMQQLFAQAAEEVAEGASWVLDADEEAHLESWNRRHLTQSVIAEKVREKLNMEKEGTSGLPHLSASEMLEIIGIDNPNNPQARECGAALRELLGKPTRIHGKDGWRVPLRDPDDTDVKPAAKRAIERAKRSVEPRTIDMNDIF